MITVFDDTGANEIHLAEVGDCTNQEAAARTLFDSIRQACMLFEGEPILICPGEHPEFPNSYGVLWQDGPKQWADGYVVCEGAIGMGFTSCAAAGQAVLFTAVDG